MTTHLLARFGFEPVARPARHALADLGFAPVTVMESKPAARPVVKAPPQSVVKGTVVKGARVRLADGTVARVLYVDPNMRIVRVRTEAGRNLTVRRKDLRQDHR